MVLGTTTQPYVPVWSFAKVPNTKMSPEENCRLISVYTRPWTLLASEASNDNPLLSELATYTILEGHGGNEKQMLQQKLLQAQLCLRAPPSRMKVRMLM